VEKSLVLFPPLSVNTFVTSRCQIGAFSHAVKEQRMKFVSAFITIFVSFLTTPSFAQNAEIKGAGATFPYPAYATWGKAYEAKTGIRINYQAIGSGGGLKQI
jgi:ABC-type phosphate transport system substrate-binding protein